MMAIGKERGLVLAATWTEMARESARHSFSWTGCVQDGARSGEYNALCGSRSWELVRWTGLSWSFLVAESALLFRNIFLCHVIG